LSVNLRPTLRVRIRTVGVGVENDLVDNPRSKEGVAPWNAMMNLSHFFVEERVDNFIVLR
jgi:hypothetical protein